MQHKRARTNKTTQTHPPLKCTRPSVHAPTTENTNAHARSLNQPIHQSIESIEARTLAGQRNGVRCAHAPGRRRGITPNRSIDRHERGALTTACTRKGRCSSQMDGICLDQRSCKGLSGVMFRIKNSHALRNLHAIHLMLFCLVVIHKWMMRASWPLAALK